jgi:3',5'-cyclic-nucleotide phosphodiesterase
MIIQIIRRWSLLAVVLTLCLQGIAQTSRYSFKLVPLGVKGGIDESNLSAYMLALSGSDNYVCLDAGTLYAGVEKAIELKTFSTEAETVLRRYIKGYLISHSHLDHVAGLIINSPDDTAKNIYAFADCIETFKTHYFTWKSWANFADAGETPQLRKYHYVTLRPDSEIQIANTEMEVKAFPLSHSNLTSTAFLIQSGGSYILYFGDTGPDEVEKSRDMAHVWQEVAPLIKDKELRAIMIEVSFPDEQPDKSLFGHLTPRWLMTELHKLEKLSGQGSLADFKIIITHVKPPQKSIEKIKKELAAENDLHLHLIYPQQGERIDL